MKAQAFDGYPSLNAWRVARRKKRIAEVAERIADLEAVDARTDAHYRAWTEARCSIEAGEVAIECSTARLRASYVDFYGSGRARSPQAWGRWMGAHYIKIPRNSIDLRTGEMVGRVYLGIAVKPSNANEI